MGVPVRVAQLSGQSSVILPQVSTQLTGSTGYTAVAFNSSGTAISVSSTSINSSTLNTTVSFSSDISGTVTLLRTVLQSDTSSGNDFSTNLVNYNNDTGQPWNVVVSPYASCTYPAVRTGAYFKYVMDFPVTFQFPASPGAFSASVYMDGPVVTLGVQDYGGSTPITCNVPGVGQDLNQVYCNVVTLPSVASVGFPYFPGYGNVMANVQPLAVFHFSGTAFQEFGDYRPGGWQ